MMSRVVSCLVSTDKTVLYQWVYILRQFAKGMTDGWIIGKRQVMKEPSSNYLQNNAQIIDV